MSNDIEIFTLDGKNNFESFGKDNGFHFWYARDLMTLLEYENYNTFSKIINKAIGVCSSLGISIEENFISMKREINGKQENDYKLSRFACYLTAMNGDIKKPQVANAQAYFITFAEAFRLCVQESGQIERVIIRDEITQREKSLSGIVKQSEIEQYQLFQDAGYLGMYNMHIGKLKDYKGVPGDRSLLDFMGKTELAANLFRITQTEEKIRNEKIRGQKNLENAHYAVGRKVRQTMQEISGQNQKTFHDEGY